MAGEERKAETDVQEDANQAHTRAEGGVEGTDRRDQEGTTGTALSGSFVGRVAGQDDGYAGETGAERRAAVQIQIKPITRVQSRFRLATRLRTTEVG